MASKEEEAAASAKLKSVAAFVGVFPEPSNLSVRVFDGGIPYRWTLSCSHPSTFAGLPSFHGTASPGQWYVFQLGLWAHDAAIHNLTAVVAAGGLESSTGLSIPAYAFSFINLEGVDVAGNSYENRGYGLARGNAGSLWIGLDIGNTPVGVYKGSQNKYSV